MRFAREIKACAERWNGRLRRVFTLVLALTMLLVALCTFAVGCTGLMAEAGAMESQGDLDGAVAIYREVLDDDPDNAEALSDASVDLLFLGRFDEALIMQEQLVALDSTDVQTRVELGFNYLNHQDRPADAAAVLLEAAQLEPSAKILTFLAQAQIASSDAVGAEETLRRAIDADPNYAHSYSTLVGMLDDQGRTEEAQQVAEQASLHGITIPDSN